MTQAVVSNELPFVGVVELLKSGNIREARARLKIPADSVTDEEFVNAMIALVNALELCSQGAQSEALPYFQVILPVMDKCQDDVSRSMVSLLAKSSEGIARILVNDPHGAFPLFNEAAKVVDKMAFYSPGLKKIALNFQAMAHVAAMRASLNVGDVQTAETYFGSVREQYRQIVALLDPNSDEDRVGYLEAYATQLEGATAFAVIDLQALDVHEAEKRIAGSESDAATVQKILETIAPGQLKDMGTIILKINRALKRLVALEKVVIFERSIKKKNRIEEFESLDRELFEVSQLALRGGKRAQTYVAFARILGRQLQNLLALDRKKVSTVDKERVSQIAMFVSLVVLVVLVQVTVHPSGILALLFFVGEVVISVIAGFGYSAVRFQGMITQYTNLISRTARGKVSAEAAAS